MICRLMFRSLKQRLDRCSPTIAVVWQNSQTPDGFCLPIYHTLTSRLRMHKRSPPAEPYSRALSLSLFLPLSRHLIRTHTYTFLYIIYTHRRHTYTSIYIYIFFLRLNVAQRLFVFSPIRAPRTATHGERRDSSRNRSRSRFRNVALRKNRDASRQPLAITRIIASRLGTALGRS